MKVLFVLALCSAASCASAQFGAVKESEIEDAIAREVAHFAVSTHPGETFEEGFYDALEKINRVQTQVGGWNSLPIFGD